jgi:GTP cyclohydrolase I
MKKPSARGRVPPRTTRKPSRDEAEEAVRILLRWAGDEPSREGLLGTPARVARAFEEWFSGYEQDLRFTSAEHSKKSQVTMRSLPCETYRLNRTASIIWLQSSAKRISATCHAAG